MPKSPSTPEITGQSETYKKALSILGMAVAATGCNPSEASDFQGDKQCRIILEEGRKEIYCFLKPGEKKQVPPKPLSQTEYEHAKTTRNEMGPAEVVDLRLYGGHFFDLGRIPEMKQENPRTLGKTYIRFPEVKKGSPRALVHFHGNGGQGYGYKNEVNVIRFTKAMQEEGDEVILISPEDGWGNFKPEGKEKDKPGNWRDFNNANTLANLIKFSERLYGHRIKDITLSSFSGGNLGTMKSLRALQKVKDKDPEMASIYERISQIAYFDSATGSEREFVANWAAAHPKGKIWNCYKNGGIYRKGNELLLGALQAKGIHPKQINWETMQWNEGHGVYEDYFRRFTGPRGN